MDLEILDHLLNKTPSYKILNSCIGSAMTRPTGDESSMKNASKTFDDPFDLKRFVHAQEGTYALALSELRLGQKRSHWMWYIFPQIDGLGHSAMAKHYAIKNVEEARGYFNHPVIGARLLECTETVLGIEGRSVVEIFGFPDDMKLESSMSLFAHISETDSVFALVLDKFFSGHRDDKTLQLLEEI
jgi:uncharacterized protein (DUF1810 family)